LPSAPASAVAQAPLSLKVDGSANRTKDANNLTQVAMAMLSYHDSWSSFPPAAICSKSGKPLLSWRVAILPFLKDQQKVYDRFKLDEPWDSEHNKKLVLLMPEVYALPGVTPAGGTTTHYRVFVGPQAGFLFQKTRRVADITDGMANTWMIVESREAVPWTKPEELDFDPKKPLPKLGNFLGGGFNVAFMNGSVHFYKKPPTEKTIRALITPAGGEVVEPEP
jgi:hypothetical protein